MTWRLASSLLINPLLFRSVSATIIYVDDDRYHHHLSTPAAIGLAIGLAVVTLIIMGLVIYRYKQRNAAYRRAAHYDQNIMMGGPVYQAPAGMPMMPPVPAGQPTTWTQPPPPGYPNGGGMPGHAGPYDYGKEN
uniref:Uncharacterized protein n=1 Tax=Mycena chlorophos TaxID=658473 RepID=A0ABQ0LST5_MYCCL|nr:predicted protein [Mycena chlorophos]